MLARNTVLNLFGQLAPLLVGAVALPRVVHGLGFEQFGLLSLSWTVLGYFSVFDLGLAPATTKFVAEALSKQDKAEAGRLVTSGLVAQLVLGTIGGAALLLTEPIITGRLLNVPPQLIDESRATFRWLAFAMPFVLISSSMTSVLQGAQRFGLLNLVRIPSSSATYLLPLLGVLMGMGVTGIVVLIVISRIVQVAVLFGLTVVTFRSSLPLALDRRVLGRLFRFGGWVTVTSIVNPILVYSDRFFLGWLVSAAAVGFYAVPSEIVSRLAVIPVSLAMTVFPTVSGLNSARDRADLEAVFTRSTKFLSLVLGPLVLSLALFGDEALGVWMGADFAIHSAIVLRILAIGTLANLLSFVPVEFLRGVGRPDLPAKLLVIQLPVYLGLVWLLTSTLGLPGAAIAWTLRMLVNAGLLFGAVHVVGGVSSAALRQHGMPISIAALALLTVLAVGFKLATETYTLAVQSLLFLVLIGGFAWVTWRILLDALERGALIRALQVWRH